MQKDSIHFFSVKSKYFAYDINTTFCAELDSVALTILPELLSGNIENLEKKYAHLYPIPQIRNCVKECKALLCSGYFGANPSRYKHFIQNNVADLCLHIAHNCNLSCEYCYGDTGAFGGDRQLMSRPIILKAIDFAFANSIDSISVNVGFFGGEPLLNFKIIREAVDYAKNKAKILNKKVTFSMASNAMLLTPDIMNFIKLENFSLLFSLDGPQKIHDQMRKTKDKKKSHSVVLKNIAEYLQQYSESFTVRGTFTRTTPNFSEQVLFLNDQGFRSVSVEPAQLAENHPHSISTPGEIARIMQEYDKLADIYLERFNKGDPLHFCHFENCLRKLIRPQPTHIGCGAGGGFIAVVPDGRIFPCFETVPEKENSIGHIASDFNKHKRRIFQRVHVDTKVECKKCWIKYSCGGGCHAFNIRYNNNINIPYKPQCEFVKYRFKLSAWILSEIMSSGEKSVRNLKKHLQC